MCREVIECVAFGEVHITPKGKHLVRRYGVYSSRGRGTWKDRPALRARAPEHWYGRAQIPAGEPDSVGPDAEGEAVEVGAASRKKAWARLLAKVYEVNPFLCPNCGGTMAVIAVIRPSVVYRVEWIVVPAIAGGGIQDPAEIRGIIACLTHKCRGPPR